MALTQSGNSPRLLANAAWLAGDSVFRFVGGLAIGIWVARYLGPQSLGELAYLLAFISFFHPLAQAGLARILVRELSQPKAREGELVGSAFAVLGVCSVAAALAAVAIFAISHRAADSGQLAMMCLLAASLGFVPFDVFGLWFQSKLQMRSGAIARNVGFAAAAMARIGLIVLAASLFWFAAVVTLEAAITALVLFYLFRAQKTTSLRLSVSIDRCKVLVSESRYVVAYGLVLTVQSRMDQIMIATLAGTEQLGQYAAVLRIVESMTFLPLALQAVTMPGLTQAKGESPNVYRDQLLNQYRWAVLMFLPFGFVLWFFAREIVGLLYGAAYAAAAPLLSLLSLRLLLAFFGVARSSFVANERLFAFSFIGAMLGALLNVGLNLVLIPRFGAEGAIWASSASFFFTIFVMDLIVARTRQNFFTMVLALLTPWRARAFDGRY
jgi:polysaccharide transporter, PST family